MSPCCLISQLFIKSQSRARKLPYIQFNFCNPLLARPLLNPLHQQPSNALMPDVFAYYQVINLDKVARHNHRHRRRQAHITKDQANESFLLFRHKEGRILVSEKLCKSLR